MTNMDNQTKVVYVVTKSNEDLDITYPIGVFSNIDLAMKKVLDGVSDDMASFNTLLDFSKIAYSLHSLNVSHSDNNGNITYSKDVVDSVTNILKMVVNYVLDDVDYEISEELFSKVQHLIQNPEQYDQQYLYDEFLSYLYHWAQLFKHFGVTCDDFNHIQEKIKQMADDYQSIYVLNESHDFNHVEFTFEQLKQRYPNIGFNSEVFNPHEFRFFIYDYWNYEAEINFYTVTWFVVDR